MLDICIHKDPHKQREKRQLLPSAFMKMLCDYRLNSFCLAKKLVQIQLHFTLITSYNAPENFIAAFRTNIAGFFILNPFFNTNLSPIRNSPQNNFFANSHGKIFNMSEVVLRPFSSNARTQSDPIFCIPEDSWGLP